MIRTIGAVCLTAALLGFAAGCGEKQPPAEPPKLPQADQPEKPATPPPPAKDKPKDHPAH